MTLFTPEHERFRERVRAYVVDRLAPFVDEWEGAEGLPRGPLAELGRAGFLGLSHSKRDGGHGLDFGYEVVLAEEVPRCRAMGVALSVLAQEQSFRRCSRGSGPRRRSRSSWFPG